MKYEYKGNVYNYVGVGKFKDSTGKWIDATNLGYSHAFLNLSIKSVTSLMYIWLSRSYIIAPIHLPVEVTDFIDKFKKA